MSAQGQRKNPLVFSSSAKNDFVTNYEPVVHFKTEKIWIGEQRKRKARDMRESELIEREQACMMKEFSVEIKEREQKEVRYRILAYVWSAAMMP